MYDFALRCTHLYIDLTLSPDGAQTW
jgi:hypothetical protein